MSREDHLPDLCIVHPLNTWLWLTLCLTPTVLHQMTACLSACEAYNLLAARLYDDCDNLARQPRDPMQAPPGPLYGLPEGNFIMPDRASVPLASIPPLQKYLPEDADGVVISQETPEAFEKLGLVPLVFTNAAESHLDEEVIQKNKVGVTHSTHTHTLVPFLHGYALLSCIVGEPDEPPSARGKRPARGTDLHGSRRRR